MRDSAALPTPPEGYVVIRENRGKGFYFASKIALRNKVLFQIERISRKRRERRAQVFARKLTGWAAYKEKLRKRGLSTGHRCDFLFQNVPPERRHKAHEHLHRLIQNCRVRGQPITAAKYSSLVGNASNIAQYVDTGIATFRYRSRKRMRRWWELDQRGLRGRRIGGPSGKMVFVPVDSIVPLIDPKPPMELIAEPARASYRGLEGI